MFTFVLSQIIAAVKMSDAISPRHASVVECSTITPHSAKLQNADDRYDIKTHNVGMVTILLIYGKCGTYSHKGSVTMALPACIWYFHPKIVNGRRCLFIVAVVCPHIMISIMHV